MDRIQDFQETVWEYYARNGRTMPWRTSHTPYNVLVSELMLQQTQVARVLPKYAEFMEAFATIEVLARAPLSDVLRAWQGLGYNRRARFLHDAARYIQTEHAGVFPDTLEGLLALPGVGKNTAGAILAYAFDKPSLFIETNIRTILFHHFFEDATTVDDKELLPLLEASLPDDNFREWYWALMDYGSHLKRTAGGRLDQSRHYKKQSPLRGSIREVRGHIITALTEMVMSEAELRTRLAADDRFTVAIEGLIRDKLITRDGTTLRLTA